MRILVTNLINTRPYARIGLYMREKESLLLKNVFQMKEQLI